MAQTKIKAGLFEGIIGNGTDGYFLMSNGDGTMTWSSVVINPTIVSIAYPGSATAADPAGGETITVTGTGFKTGATVTIGGTAAPAVSYVSATQITFTTPAKAAGDYDIVVTNTDTGSATYINGISYNGIPTWTTAAGSLGTFASDTTISTITLQATEPDAGTITFSITNGALPTGLSLSGANIDGTTTLETADTLYTFTVTATDDESQATPRTFTITVEKYIIPAPENFEIVAYTGNGGTQAITSKIGKAASFNGSSSRITTNLITPNTQDLSWSFWVKDLVHNGSSSMNTLLLDYKNNYAFINYTSSNTIYANARSSSTNANIYVQSSAIDTSSWRHIVFVSSLSSGSFLYIDGALVDSNTASMPSRSNLNYGSGLEIGWNPAEGSPFTSYALDGKIDQVRIFNKALSSSEVTTLYGENNTSTTKSTTDIFDDGSGVALYELDEDANGTAPSETLVETNQLINLRAENYTSGSTWTDISGQNNNATLTNPTKPTTESVHFDYANLGAQNQYGGNNVSIEFFIKTTNTDDDYFLTAYNGGGLIPGEFLLYMPLSSANSKPYLTVSGSTSSASNLSFDHTVVQNDWTHYVLVYDSSLTGNTNRFIMYVNGVEVTTSVEGGVDNFDNSNFMGDTSTLFIGKRGGGTDYEEMDIKEFRIYSKSLSSQEVAQNYAASAFKYNGTPTNINFLGMAFQPDLVWIKDRDNSNPHELSDSVRGVSGTLNTNATNAEYINASFQITSLDTNGFTVVDDSAGNYAVNGNGIDYVAWCWKAADTTTTISAGTVGNTIASDVRANTEAGFSIVSFTSNGAASVVSTGHGLSVEPEMVIFKNRDNSSYWLTYHKDIGDNGYLALQDTFGTQSFTPFFDMTSTTIAVRQSSLASNNEKCIAYCFHSVDGYQKVGSYTGNRPTDVVIDTGFAPRFVMIKCDASGESWTILDSARGDNLLHPNTSGTEQSYTGVSLTSTGFTVHDSGLSNTNGATHIYLAIA